MLKTFSASKLTLIALAALIVLPACKNGSIFGKKKQQSSVTGWNYDDKNYGNFHVLKANEQKVKDGQSACVITYGMGIYWAKAAAKKFDGRIEIIDLRTLFPLDEEPIFSTVQKHGRCLILTVCM